MTTFLNTKQVAKLLNVDYQQVRWLYKSGQIKPLTVGHVRLYRPKDIETIRRLLVHKLGNTMNVNAECVKD